MKRALALGLSLLLVLVLLGSTGCARRDAAPRPRVPVADQRTEPSPALEQALHVLTTSLVVLLQLAALSVGVVYGDGFFYYHGSSHNKHDGKLVWRYPTQPQVRKW